MPGQIIYDADCGFCARAAYWIDDVPAVAWQSLDLASIGATQDEADMFVGWIEDGRVTALGAPAIAAALRSRGGWLERVGWVLDLPGVRGIAQVGYRLVAAHRYRLPGGTEACRRA
jgi:predicted DCC family thiol-disulfide oxidoreductase YuxK